MPRGGRSKEYLKLLSFLLPLPLPLIPTAKVSSGGTGGGNGCDGDGVTGWDGSKVENGVEGCGGGGELA